MFSVLRAISAIAGTVWTCIGLAQIPVEALSPAPALDRLTLRQAEQLFADRNRELLSARRAVEGAEADILSAGARPNPNLTISTTNISPSQGIGSGSWNNKRVDTTIGLSQLFERGNKRELRIGSSEAVAEAARNDRADIERQQGVALHAAYFELLLAQEKLRITEETSGLFQKTLDAAGLRLKAGDISATEVARISVDVLRAQNDARAARADLQRAQTGLAYMTGTEREAARLRAADDWPALEVLTGAADRQSVIDQRADVRAAQARVVAAGKARELAQSLRTRDITAGIQYERYPGDVANNSMGFFVSVPLFTRYYYDGEIRRAEVEFQAANDNLDRVRALALNEINRAQGDAQSAADRVRRFREALLAAAEKAAAGAEFAYSRGAIGVMDLLDARRQLYAARLEAATVQADYAKALAAWRAATRIEPVPAAASRP